jgi:hypothetical protein
LHYSLFPSDHGHFSHYSFAGTINSAGDALHRF